MRILSVDVQGAVTRLGVWTRPRRIANVLRRSGVEVAEVSCAADTAWFVDHGVRLGPEPQHEDSKSYAIVGALQANLEVVRQCFLMLDRLGPTSHPDVVLVHEFDCFLAAELVAERFGATLALTKTVVVADYVAVPERRGQDVEDAALLGYVLDLEAYSVRRADLVFSSSDPLRERIAEKLWRSGDAGGHLLPLAYLWPGDSPPLVKAHAPATRPMDDRSDSVVLYPLARGEGELDEIVRSVAQLRREGHRVVLRLLYGDARQAPAGTVERPSPWLDEVWLSDRDDFLEAYSRADVVVLPRCDESAMLTALDATMVGTPVVMISAGDRFAAQLELPTVRYEAGALSSAILYVLRHRELVVQRIAAVANHVCAADASFVDHLANCSSSRAHESRAWLAAT